MTRIFSPLLRRILLLLLALSLTLPLTACQSGSAAPDPPPSVPEAGEPSSPETENLPEAEKPQPTVPEKPLPEEPVPDAPPAENPEPPTPPSGDSAPPSSGKHPPASDSPLVALTFDDGPHAEYTDQILDILEENGATATFFEVGRNLYNDPDAVRRAEAMGCEIGSHSYRHADLGQMSAESIADDLGKADAIFQEVLGHAPTLLRPPYGSLNSAVKFTTGRSIITWSIDTEDWRSKDTEKIVATIHNAGDLSGQVILMHSTYATSVEAVRQLVPWLQAQGYQLVTISELITQYYGDNVLANGTYGYSYFKNGKDVILPPDQPQEPAQPQVPAAA